MTQSRSTQASRRRMLARTAQSVSAVVFSSAMNGSFAFQKEESAPGKKGKIYPDERKKNKDPKSGATVWQLTDTPGKWTEVLYFTNRTATRDSRFVIYVSNRGSSHGLPTRLSGEDGGLDGIDLFKLDLRSGESVQLTEGGNVLKDSPEISYDGTEVYYISKGNVIRSVNLENLKEREIVKCDPQVHMGHALSVSRDGKTLAGHQILEPKKHLGYRWAPWASRDRLLAVNLADGEIRTIVDGNSPLGHLAICPSDPNLLLYSFHSNIWQSQRAWLMQMDGTGARPIFPQRLGEGCGHEIWGASGKTVYMVCYGGRQPQGLWVSDLRGNEHCVLAGGTVGHCTANAEEDRFAMDERYTDGSCIWLARKGSVEPKLLCQMPVSWFSPGPNGAIGPQWVHPNIRFLPDGTGITYASGDHSGTNVYLVQV